MMDSLPRFLLLAQLASTLFMTGVIWFVQVVHYPLFAKTGLTDFHVFEKAHTSLTTWVVAPPMLIELISALLLIWYRPAGISNVQCGIGLALLGVIWLSTLFLQIPCHELLSRDFDPVIHQKLVSTNWIRTVAWSLRALLVLYMIWSVWE